MNTPTPYQLLGGETVLRALVERFYAHMDEMPEVETLRGMHAQDLTSAKDKLFKFLSGWLGGPQLFWEEFGHPRLRFRHLPFPIGTHERDQWMLCMAKALEETPMDPGLRDSLFDALAKVATHMINQPD